VKKVLFILVVLAFATGMAMAQNNAYSPSTDVLGAHQNHGRGCAGCHAPHSGSLGNGIAAAKADPNTNYVALWGQDMTNLYGATLAFGDKGGFTTTLPTDLSGDSHLKAAGTPTDPRVSGLLMCLSCHDGNLATGSMMLNQVYETLPAGYGAAQIPTLLGKSTDKFGYQNDHPVGENAEVGCGGTYDWDCTDTNGVIAMTGPNSSKFVLAYGITAKPTAWNNKAIVVCTTCHNQHVMNVYKGTVAGQTGYFKTYFGIKGAYDPSSPNGNTTAQFCRQCHGGEANEMNNSTAGTVF
jgi:cytochrome c553